MVSGPKLASRSMWWPKNLLLVTAMSRGREPTSHLGTTCMFWVLRHQQGLSGQYLRRHTCIFSLHRGQQPKDAMSPASEGRLQRYAALKSTSLSPPVPKYRVAFPHLICSAQAYSPRMGSFQCSTHGIPSGGGGFWHPSCRGAPLTPRQHPLLASAHKTLRIRTQRPAGLNMKHVNI